MYYYTRRTCHATMLYRCRTIVCVESSNYYAIQLCPDHNRCVYKLLISKMSMAVTFAITEPVWTAGFIKNRGASVWGGKQLKFLQWALNLLYANQLSLPHSGSYFIWIPATLSRLASTHNTNINCLGAWRILHILYTYMSWGRSVKGTILDEVKWEKESRFSWVAPA